MSAGYTTLVWWAVPLWSVGCVLAVSAWLWKRKGAKVLSASLTVLAAVAAIPLVPGVLAKMPKDTPLQVVYRFDDHRWLELEGWECEGALWYVDSKLGIRTEASSQFYRIVFYRYIHPSTKYIAIPLEDFSGILISRDGGRTFEPAAHVFVPDWGHYDGQVPQPKDVKQFVVTEDRGYIEMKNGRTMQSSSPFGDAWGRMYVDYPWPGEERSIASYSRPQFQDMKSKAPEVKNYTGWTHMKCDPNVGIVPKKESLAGVPGLIYSLEAYTLGAPIYFGSRLFRKNIEQ